MSTPNIVTFWGRDIAHPNGVPLRKFYRWEEGVGLSPAIAITPAATETIFLYKLGIFTVSNPYIQADYQMHVFIDSDTYPPSGPINLIVKTFDGIDECYNNESNYVSNDLFSMTRVEAVTQVGIGITTYATEIKFTPPVHLSGDSESFNIRMEEIATGDPVNFGTKRGTVRFCFRGWALLTSDL